MRAAVFRGAHDLTIEQVPRPAPGRGELAVDVAFCGLCGSDLHEYLAGPVMVPQEPHPLTGAALPVILGHEFSGVVSAVGPEVRGFTVGDAVCVEPLHTCGECRSCRDGAYNLCSRRAFHGLQANGGGLSETTVVPAARVHCLPDGVSLAMGALVEPMAVAFHAVRRSGLLEVGPDAAGVLVFGGGPIGLGIWLALRAHGWSDVVLVEPADDRRCIAEGLGLRTVIHPHDLAGLAGERSFDVAFDASGAPAAIRSALETVSALGTVVSVAVYGEEFPVNPNLLVRAEATWTASLAYTAEDFAAVLELMAAGAYDPTGWVDVRAMDEVEEALTGMASGTTGKILLRVAGGTGAPSEEHAAGTQVVGEPGLTESDHGQVVAAD